MKQLIHSTIHCTKEQFISELTQEIHDFYSFFASLELKLEGNEFSIIVREKTKGMCFLILFGKIMEVPSGLQIVVSLRTTFLTQFVLGILFVFSTLIVLTPKVLAPTPTGPAMIVFLFLLIAVFGSYIYFPRSYKAKKFIREFFAKRRDLWQETSMLPQNPAKKFTVIEKAILLYGVFLMAVFSVHTYQNMQQQKTVVHSIQAKRLPTLSELDGSYAPKQRLIFGNYRMMGLVIDSNRTSHAAFWILNIKEVTKRVFYECPLYQAQSGNIQLKSEKTPIGILSLQGVFLPAENGNYWLVPAGTTILRGKLEIVRDNKIIYSNPSQEFHFHIEAPRP